MELSDYIPSDPESCVWDVVVIGTGAGGGTAGFNLARLGRSVLFLERGGLPHPPEDEAQSASATQGNDLDETSVWPYKAERKGDVSRRTKTPIGCCVGGSTVFFGMVMERFRPIDFTPGRLLRESWGTSLPSTWPIEYCEIEPYYREAEELFRLRGTDDPLMPAAGSLLQPAERSEVESVIYKTLGQAGLHPYALHCACEGVPGCDGCSGQFCLRRCRNDVGRMCVLPALERHGANILTGCRVTRLETRGREVQRATCVIRGRNVTIRGRVFVLALHALLTPELLLRSASESFPEGLGNRSGMVGRNLMCHLMDHYLLRFDERCEQMNELLNHGISLNDFYQYGGVKLGNLQAHSVNPSRLLEKLNPAGTVHLLSVLEDFPYLHNRVTPAPGIEQGVCWEYTYSDELRFRRDSLLAALVDRLRPLPLMRVDEHSGRLITAHACGTCRFGDDARVSVLDRFNRIHDLDNAYVVDASFFPSSGGINPSLTIVANSLRVSEVIARR